MVCIWRLLCLAVFVLASAVWAMPGKGIASGSKGSKCPSGNSHGYYTESSVLARRCTQNTTSVQSPAKKEETTGSKKKAASSIRQRGRKFESFGRKNKYKHLDIKELSLSGDWGDEGEASNSNNSNSANDWRRDEAFFSRSQIYFVHYCLGLGWDDSNKVCSLTKGL